MVAMGGRIPTDRSVRQRGGRAEYASQKPAAVIRVPSGQGDSFQGLLYPCVVIDHAGVLRGPHHRIPALAGLHQVARRGRSGDRSLGLTHAQCSLLASLYGLSRTGAAQPAETGRLHGAGADLRLQARPGAEVGPLPPDTALSPATTPTPYGAASGLRRWWRRQRTAGSRLMLYGAHRSFWGDSWSLACSSVYTPEDHPQASCGLSRRCWWATGASKH